MNENYRLGRNGGSDFLGGKFVISFALFPFFVQRSVQQGAQREREQRSLSCQGFFPKGSFPDGGFRRMHQNRTTSS